MLWPATLDLALLGLVDCDRGPDITVVFSYDKLRQLNSASATGFPKARWERGESVREHTAIGTLLVADSEYEIHDGVAGFGEFSPALAPQMRSWHAEALKQIEGYRVDFTLRKAPGAVALESALAPMVDDGLGQDAPR